MTREGSGRAVVRRAATLRDVATAAGVDASTVSKVLSETISVRPETRTRVLEAAARLSYQPNAAARGLRWQRTGAVGMLLPDITNPVYAAIVRGAVRQADQLGYSLLLAEIDEEAAEGTYRRLVQEKRIDGLLIATAKRTANVPAQLRRDGVPHVFVNRRVAGSGPSVTVDDEAGAGLAARTMAEHGHQKLGVIAGPKDVDTAHRRLKGFRAEVERLDLPPPVVAHGDFTAAGGFDAMSKLLRSRQKPTAVFLSNFVAAVGALRAIDASGLKVPDDVSVVVFDDPQIAEFMSPPLTSIAMPFEEMGGLALATLHELLRGGAPKDAIVGTAPQLRLRSSLCRRLQLSHQTVQRRTEVAALSVVNNLGPSSQKSTGYRTFTLSSPE